MLRKNSAGVSASTRSGRRIDDNEKGSKLKRRKDSQTKAIFFCLGIISFLGLIAKVKVNHFHKFTSKRLRKRSSKLSVQNEEIVEPTRVVDFLPPHSLYKLEVENIYGQMVDFSKFKGMISLVVNVACS